MDREQSWFQRPHRWLLIALCLGAIGTELWDILMPEPAKLHLVGYAPLVTLALLSLYVLHYLEEDGQRNSRMSELGIKRIYRSRIEQEQIASYQGLLASAKKELFIVGITLKDISREQSAHLRQKASAGCRIDLLMLHPKFKANTDPVLDPVAKAEQHDLTRAFGEAIDRIRLLAKDITNTKGTLTVKFYTTSPTLSLTVRDGKSHSGEMHMEIVPHQIQDEPFRPILDLMKDGKDEIFSEIYDRYRDLWDHSIPYIVADHSGIRVDNNLDREISNSLHLATNWRVKEAPRQHEIGGAAAS
jgi:hypothetical protein